MLEEKYHFKLRRLKLRKTKTKNFLYQLLKCLKII